MGVIELNSMLLKFTCGCFLEWGFNRLHFLEHFRFTEKLSRKYREFPCTPPPSSHTRMLPHYQHRPPEWDICDSWDAYTDLSSAQSPQFPSGSLGGVHSVRLGSLGGIPSVGLGKCLVTGTHIMASCRVVSWP